MVDDRVSVPEGLEDVLRGRFPAVRRSGGQGEL